MKSFEIFFDRSTSIALDMWFPERYLCGLIMSATNDCRGLFWIVFMSGRNDGVMGMVVDSSMAGEDSVADLLWKIGEFMDGEVGEGGLASGEMSLSGEVLWSSWILSSADFSSLNFISFSFNVLVMKWMVLRIVTELFFGEIVG